MADIVKKGSTDIREDAVDSVRVGLEATAAWVTDAMRLSDILGAVAYTDVIVRPPPLT